MPNLPPVVSFSSLRQVPPCDPHASRAAFYESALLNEQLGTPLHPH
jgi:hypothetical protein